MLNFKVSQVVSAQVKFGRLCSVRLISGIFLLMIFSVLGCGRYRAPLTTEELAQAMVETLTVTTAAKGVGLKWVAAAKARL